MAHIKTTEILTRARELVEDGLGDVRAIADTRFDGSLHDGVDERQMLRLGIASKKPASARIVSTGPHPQRLARLGTVQIVAFVLEVRVVRTLDISGQVDDDTRDAAEALAAQDGDVLTQVFELPNNLTQTAASDTTDWIGANWTGSTHRFVNVKKGEAARLDSIHRFDCTAVTRPATT